MVVGFGSRFIGGVFLVFFFVWVFNLEDLSLGGSMLNLIGGGVLFGCFEYLFAF